MFTVNAYTQLYDIINIDLSTFSFSIFCQHVGHIFHRAASVSQQSSNLKNSDPSAGEGGPQPEGPAAQVLNMSTVI